MSGFRGDERAAQEARRLGEALMRLRKAAGLNQAEAGARAGMTGQGWGLYESGKRPGLFRPDVQRRLTAALDADPETLAMQAAGEAAGVAGGRSNGVESAGRGFKDVPEAPVRRGPGQLVLTDDSLDPWAGSGTVVDYDPERFPRRGQGCVVESRNGSVSVWLFDGADAGTLHLRGGQGGLDALVRMSRQDVLAVSAVTARREQ